MKVINDIKPMQEISEFLRRSGLKIGLVPTMGFLHEGHVGLMINAKDDCDIVIASIFVNPTQFSPNEDFNQYPRDFLRDFYICKNAGVDYIFYPDATAMYGDDYKTFVNVTDISNVCEGVYRPTHFQGVTTVVLKLLNITKPHAAYFGQKDAQQSIILTKMIADLNIDVEMKIVETIREENGLAKSSRNTFLSDEDKESASILFKTLNLGKTKILENDFDDKQGLIKKLKSNIETNSPKAVLQYIAITDNKLMKDIDDIKNYKGEILISLASFFGKTRLIDNILFKK